ncbi:MAG: hypothetical protein KJ770_07670 [Actinobacteria bacterium]|nr:hypothetical protein [Actinomycetota bacterium]
MNKTQKLILAIFVPIIFFFIALVIANNLGVTSVMEIVSENDPRRSPPDIFDKYRHGPPTITSHTHNPFDWGKTWYVWLLYSASCCLFEFLLFKDKKIIAERNKED